MAEIPTADWSRINDAADRFERAWKHGPRPAIEDYLAEAEPGLRTGLAEELLRVELELRRQEGEVPRADEYLGRFPEDAAVIEAVVTGGTSARSGDGKATTGPPGSRPARLDPSPMASVLAALAETIGSVSRVLLRETEIDDGSPVVRPSSPEMPVRAGRYQLIGEIDHGGMGAVLKGRDPDMGRDLAVKVLLKEHRDDPDMVRRFIEEAQICGQLQHPGIVPVHELGRFDDGRPYFTMKLVRGRTLAALLADRPMPEAERPRFLGIFEQICQPVAYAHARGVIHRDLKPSNIMVGAFGEVQVMDWGLAKVLPRDSDSGPEDSGVEAAPSVIRTVRSGSDAEASTPGSVMGTPAYMAPEQARGDIEGLSGRSDVFGLGSILCEILTGRPAYTGLSRQAILRKAVRGDTADALERLDGCGADDELTALARRCLATEPEARPRDAGALAAAITAYLAGVQERLRTAELGRVEAQARAEEETKRRWLADDLAREARLRADEERRRRRVTVALAASVLALAGLGGGTWLVAERSRSERQVAVAHAFDEARRKHEAALAPAADDPALWSEALAAVERAEGLLAQGGEADQERQVDGLRASITAGRDQARQEAAWLVELADIRATKARSGDGGDPDRRYAAVFRAAGLDPDALGREEIGVRIRARRPALAEGLIAALDDWAAVRREQRDDVAGARRLLIAARSADTDEWRGRLREMQEQAGSKERLEALRKLANTARIEELTAVSLDLLGVALLDEGDAEAAVHVLRGAQRSHPRDPWLKYNLARALRKLGRTEEAIRYLMAARTLRPETAHELAHVLEGRGETDEALAIFRDLVTLRPDVAAHWVCYGGLLQERGDRARAGEVLEKAVVLLRERIRSEPKDDSAHYNLGMALRGLRRMAEAITAYKEAIRINPRSANAHVGIGQILREQGDLDGAIAEYRAAIRLKPEDAMAHNNLGAALVDQGKLADAIAECRAAIQLQPDLAMAHLNLGFALLGQGKRAEAIAECRTAVRLRPDEFVAHLDLGLTLEQESPAEAIAEYREAIRLRPDLWSGHNNLGNILRNQGKLDEAIIEYREAIRLEPDEALAHTGFGETLRDQGHLDEAIAEFREAIRLQPDMIAAHNSLGHALHDQGKEAEAIAEYRAAIRIKLKSIMPSATARPH